MGEENYCLRRRLRGAAGPGGGWDGGLAEYLLVHSARHLLVLPPTLHPREAAPLADAGLTAYHAVRRSAGLLRPGASVVVLGVGGLGHVAVQVLKALGPATVIAVDRARDKLELATEVGADRALRWAGPDRTSLDVMAASAGYGADLVLDFVGSDETLAAAAQVVRTGGGVTVVGLAGGTYGVGYGTVPHGCTFRVTYWGSISELAEVIALAHDGRVRLHTEHFALEQVEEAFDRLRAGTVRGRAVVTP
jgi:propanol-preferring alcohol dehydrogenase